ncbi:FeoA family protein [Lacticaseibacillus nasuensis]|nr:FeoA family protein [Lacticaseibacillus nasuensis]MCX2455007.1 ferrous iron transport protein A [Lacticaseibacillus nasuensis]
MTPLSELRRPGAVMIMAITASTTLTRHLGELGLRVGSRLTVIQPAAGRSGLLVYFQGQRLAMSDDIAAQLQVQSVAATTNQPTVSLADLPVHRHAVVATIAGRPELRRRLMDMGLTRGTLIELRQVAPLGDPLELAVRGYKLSLRKAEAAVIQVAEVEA